MNIRIPTMAISAILFFIGIGLMIVGAITGKGGVFLLFFIPVFYGTGIFSMLGVLCIMFAMIVLFYSFVFSFHQPVSENILYPSEPNYEYRKKSKIGGVIFLGPIPIVFGSDRNTVNVMVITAVLFALMILFYFIFLFLVYRV